MPERVVGRERELEITHTFLETIMAGPAALVIEGGPGIGKSTLWNACLEAARGRSLTVLAARPVDAEASLGFSALADLLEGTAEAALSELPDPQRHALAVALLREEPGPSGSDRRAVAVATLSLLRVLARARPVLVAVDDVQWLDQSSAQVLAFVARRLSTSRIGILVSAADQPKATEPSFEHAVPDGILRRVALAPLTLEALRELIRDRYGGSFSRPALMRIHQASGGNPFYALEIARSLGELRHQELSSMWVPDSLRRVVESRIAELPRAVREILLAAATMATPSIGILAAAIGVPVGRAFDLLEVSSAAGLTQMTSGQVRFVHPIFSSAIDSAATDAARRRTHRRLAGVVEEIEDRARHLALSTVSPDPEVAELLDAAAEHARLRGAPEAAVLLSEHARRLTPAHDETGRLRRTVTAAEYQFHAGDLIGARALLEQSLAEQQPGLHRASALRLLGEIEFHANRPDVGAAILAEALAEADGEPRIAAGVEVRLAFAAVNMGDFTGGKEHSRRALEYASAIEDNAVLAEALAVASMAAFLTGDGVDEAGIVRALELEDCDREAVIEMRPSLIAGDLALYVGDVGRAVEILSPLRERVLERGEESDVVGVAFPLVWAECWRGDLAAAAAHAEEALDVAIAIRSPVLEALANASGAFAAGWLGDMEMTIARAERVRRLAEATGLGLATQWSQWAIAVCALAHDDARAAGEALDTLSEEAERSGVLEPVRAPFLPDAAEAFVALGDLERAERVLDLFDEAARRQGRSWALAAAARARALLVAARGQLDEAVRLAEDALTLGESSELRVDLGRTLLVLGKLERRRRHRSAAADDLTRARELFTAIGADGWAQRAGEELGRVGLRRGSPEDMTATERRVATLAAAGLTNREVAAAMFVSPKTVESNLVRVYAKLGIRSRAELGARLGPGRSPGSPSAALPARGAPQSNSGPPLLDS